jgi:hypothetical protein
VNTELKHEYFHGGPVGLIRPAFIHSRNSIWSWPWLATAIKRHLSTHIILPSKLKHGHGFSIIIIIIIMAPRSRRTTIHQGILRRADSPSKADSYERTTAFLSDWIEPSTSTATATATAAVLSVSISSRARVSVPNLPLPSGTLRRRCGSAVINNGRANDYDEAMNSLVNSLLRTSPMFHEHHQNQSRPSWMSPCCLGAVLYEESLNAGAGGRGIRPLPFGARPTVTQQRALTRERV